MADTEDTRKSPRTCKKPSSKKLHGFYLTEKGQTVHMSAVGAVSWNESDDDNSWKIKATRKQKPSDDDIITHEEDHEDNQDETEGNQDADGDPKSPTALNDGPDLDWHILPAKGKSDDNAELYSGRQNSTINILAEIHSASPPGYRSPKSTAQNTSNHLSIDSPTSSMISPVSSPNKNGCVVSREDKIIFHKRLNQGPPGAPVRKSSRIQKGTFKKPADPQQQTDTGTTESQLSTHLAAGSSVVDSPVSDASISPACLTPDTSMNDRVDNNVDGVKETNNDAVDVFGEDDRHVKQTTVATGTTNPDVAEGEVVEEVHLDDVNVPDIGASSKVTDVQMDESLNSKESYEDIIQIDGKQQEDKGNAQIDQAASVSTEAVNVDKVNKDVETGEICSQETNLKEPSHSNKLDESDILETLMNTSSPKDIANQGNESDTRDNEVNRIEDSEPEKSDTAITCANIAVQQSTEMEGDDCHHNASLNTSTEEFVSADEMPFELPHDNAEIEDCASDSLPCTPPMSPTKRNEHLEEMRRSLTKDCKVMLTNTPTPPRHMAKLGSKNKTGDKTRKESDFDESFHSLDSDEEERPKIIKPKKSQRRRRSVKSLTELMDEGDDFPVASTKKKGFVSQFQRFLLLTKDLDDTPSDKGTPATTNADNVFEDSPATSLTNQLRSFSLETPVSKQDIHRKKISKSPKRLSKNVDKKIAESSSSPLKRKLLTSKSDDSKQKTPKKRVKTAFKVKKEPILQGYDAHTPERQKIVYPPETPLTPLVNLAKQSDKSAMMEYFSPKKLQVNVINTPPKKFCSPVRVSLQSPVQSLMQHLSPNNYKVKIESPSTKVLQEVCNSKNFCVSLSKDEISPSRLVNQGDIKSLGGAGGERRAKQDDVVILDAEQYLQENDPVCIETKGTEEVCQMDTMKKVKNIGGIRKKTTRSRRRSTKLVPHGFDHKESVQEGDNAEGRQSSKQNRKSMTSEIDYLGSKIEQVSLHSGKKKQRTKKSANQQEDDEMPKVGTRSDKIGQEDDEPMDDGLPGGVKESEDLNIEPLENFNPFPSDEESEDKFVRPKRSRKSKVAGRRRSTRLLQRRRDDAEPVIHNDAWDKESIISEPPAERSIGSYKFRETRSVSCAGSTCSTDTESLASLDSYQSANVFDDFEVLEFSQKRTSKRRRSVRLAKRQSLQLGNFDNFGRGENMSDGDRGLNKSVGLTESEVRELTSVPSSTRKRTKSRSSRNDDVESVVSVASSTSEVVFCGIFKSPEAPKTPMLQERSEDEKMLWDDFDVEFDDEPVKKPRKTKQKKQETSRRMSSRLRGGRTSFLELTVKGEIHEVEEGANECDVEAEESEIDEELQSENRKVIATKKDRRGKKDGRTRKETKEDRVPLEESGAHDIEVIDLVPDVCGLVPAKKSRRHKKGSSSHKGRKDDSVTSTDDVESELTEEVVSSPRSKVLRTKKSRKERKGSRSQSEAECYSLKSDDTEITAVEGEVGEDSAEKLTSPDDEVVSSPKKRRSKKGSASQSEDMSDTIQSDGISMNMPTEVFHDHVEEPAGVNSNTKDGIEDNSQTLPSKKDRRQKRKAIQSFKLVQLEEESDKMVQDDIRILSSVPTESNEILVGNKATSDPAAAADLQDILTDLEVGHSPSSSNNPEPEIWLDEMERQTTSETCSYSEQEHDIAPIPAEDIEVPCDLNAPSAQILGGDSMSMDFLPPSKELDDSSALVGEIKKQRKTRSKSLQVLKPEEEVDVRTDNIMMLGGLTRIDEGTVDHDDNVLADLKVGTSPSRDEDEFQMAEKRKKAKKSRRRSSKTFQPVPLELLQDQQEDHAMDTQDACFTDICSSTIDVPNVPNRDCSIMHMEGDFLEDVCGEVETNNEQTKKAQKGKAKRVTRKAASKKTDDGPELDVQMDESISSRNNTESSETFNDDIVLGNDDFDRTSQVSGSCEEQDVEKKHKSTRRKRNTKTATTHDRSENVAEQREDEGRKSRRLASQPKVNYTEPANLNISDLASLDDSCNISEDNSSPKRTQRRKSITKRQCQTPEEKPKRGKKRKSSVASEQEVEQLYLTRGKTISDPDGVTTDLLETIFESPVHKPSGTPILISKRRYRRTQTFPEKPWHPRPGKSKTGGRKTAKKRGGAKKKAPTALYDEEIEAHLNEVLADLAELSPVAKSPKSVMTPFPRQHSQSRIGDILQDD